MFYKLNTDVRLLEHHAVVERISHAQNRRVPDEILLHQLCQQPLLLRFHVVGDHILTQRCQKSKMVQEISVLQDYLKSVSVQHDVELIFTKKPLPCAYPARFVSAAKSIAGQRFSRTGWFSFCRCFRSRLNCSIF